MNALYIIFSLIPIVCAIIAFLPEISGRSEAVPVGGFEYSIFSPRRYLVAGGIGIGAFGIIFLLITDSTLPVSGTVAVIILCLTAVFEGISIFSLVFYFGYRLTVRGGIIFYKIPLRRESSLPISSLTSYSVRVRKNGECEIRMVSQKQTLVAIGKGTDLLLCDLEKRNIEKK